MQVGFTMLEAGFCRSRETVNVLMECIVDTCLCGILFYAIGFSFIFSHGNGFIGYHWFFLQGVPATYETSGVAFLALWIFQFAFARPRVDFIRCFFFAHIKQRAGAGPFLVSVTGRTRSRPASIAMSSA